MKTPTPKHRRCTACGHNPHKVVVVFPPTAPQAKHPDGQVHGFCPGCWDADRVAKVAKFGGRVVADHRANRGN